MPYIENIENQPPTNANIISKWQTKGHVYEHKPNLVPSIYGDISNIEYYNPPK